LIGIPFMLWGTYSYFEGGGGNLVVARVAGVDISADRYRTVLDQQRRNAQQTLRGADRRLFDSEEFKRGVLEGMIEDVLLIEAARDEGYRVSDLRLAQTIRAEPQFQNNGRFDPKLYELRLRQSGMDVRAFEARLRADLTTSQAGSGFAEGGIVSDQDLAGVLRLQEQRREAGYALLVPDRFLADVRIGPEEIEAYYKAHPEQFKAPERVRVDFLRLSAETIGGRIKIAEEEVRKAYDEQSDRFVTPAQRRASHLLIALPGRPGPEEEKKALARIEDLRRQAVSGGDFAALARKHSEDIGTSAGGGDLGIVERGAFPPEFERALEALKPGEVSKPVRTASGYHLIRLTSFKPEVKKPYAEARATLEKELRQRRVEEQFFDLAERFRTVVYEQPDTLQPAAQALGLKIEHSDWFTRKEGTGIAAEAKVREASFDPEVLNGGRNSPAIELGAGSLVAVKLAGHEPAALRPLAAVRAEIEGTLRQERARADTRKAGEALRARVEKAGTLAGLAAEYRAVYQAPRVIGRRDKLDPALLKELFRAKRPEGGRTVYGGVELADGRYAVFALTRVEDGDPARADEAARQQAQRWLAERRGREFYTAYRNGLRRQADVKVFPGQL